MRPRTTRPFRAPVALIDLETHPAVFTWALHAARAMELLTNREQEIAELVTEGMCKRYVLVTPNRDDAAFARNGGLEMSSIF